MMTPFVVGRESSVRALEEALTGDRKIFLATQHDASSTSPRPRTSTRSGTIGNIVQSVKMPDGNIKVLVEGVERAKPPKSTTRRLLRRHRAHRQDASLR
jgi:ATP-dependent Lon protease